MRWGCALLVALAAATVPPGAAASVDGSAGDFTLGGTRCRLIEVPTAAPVGAGSCGGVRPGAIVDNKAGQCTFNFLFSAPNSRRYMGTAGHCVLNRRGERTWGAGGPVARSASGKRVGRFAYAGLSDRDDLDFALVRLDRDTRASPSMCHFGGPTGVNTSRPSGPVVLHHHGAGIAAGSVLPARSAVALGMPHPRHVFAQGVATPGDSGSGIITGNGGAVGVIVAIGVGSESIGTDGVDAGVVAITRLAPQLARAERALGTQLRLRTAPVH